MKAWMKTVALLCLMGLSSSASAQNTYTLPLVMPASSAGLEGFMRIINRSSRSGAVRIQAFDDAGVSFGPVTLSIDAGAAVHFNSADLERGSPAKGLPTGVGDGEGNWRLELETDLVLAPLAYVRTADGFVTSMHDVVSATEGRHSVVFFNPGGNRNQVSRLRLINPSAGSAEVEVTARDDTGAAAPGGAVRLTLAPGAARTLSAQDLEAGGSGFEGSFGDGTGKWRLSVTSSVAIDVMSLLASPTGHIANLSAEPAVGQVTDGVFQVPEMVEVSAGSYSMGSPESEEDRREVEGPVHEVTIARPFSVGKYEVTRGEFARFVSETGHDVANVCRIYVGEALAPNSPYWRGATWGNDRNWKNPGFSQTDAHPVVCVSWFDAKAYTKWLSGKTGDEYRLMSESEWEYVARGGTVTARYWGESAADQCRYANGADASTSIPWRVDCNDGHARTAPVGSYEANPYGVHDMMGNVSEWVEDGWWTRYTGAPVDGSARLYGGSYYNPTRGGSWRNSRDRLRSASRHRAATPTGSAWLGFRVARTLSPTRSAAAEGGAGNEEAGSVQGSGSGAVAPIPNPGPGDVGGGPFQ